MACFRKCYLVIRPGRADVVSNGRPPRSRVLPQATEGMVKKLAFTAAVFVPFLAILQLAPHLTGIHYANRRREIPGNAERWTARRFDGRRGPHSGPEGTRQYARVIAPLLDSIASPGNKP